jgi:hypothetical protein
MARYAAIDQQTNKVRNVCEWDGRGYDPESAPNAWRVPDGVFMVRSEQAHPGDNYDPSSGTFTHPDPSDEPEPARPVSKLQELEARISALEAKAR